jgi:hypothetical protein
MFIPKVQQSVIEHMPYAILSWCSLYIFICFDFAGKASRTLSWWCFNPGISMEEFGRLGVGSIILTSGTLSPMDSFAQELKL